MRIASILTYTLICGCLVACGNSGEKKITQPWSTGTSPALPGSQQTLEQTGGDIAQNNNVFTIHTGNTTPEQLVSFAKEQQGIPYLHASADPAQGFDCSGFITYVFKHFNIVVPRSSVDFTDVGHEVPVEQALPGDFILFTGTDSTIRVVGHMGIVVYNENDELQFIHSTSGKAWGVTITPLNEYYRSRFVKAIRIFNSRA